MSVLSVISTIKLSRITSQIAFISLILGRTSRIPHKSFISKIGLVYVSSGLNILFAKPEIDLTLRSMINSDEHPLTKLFKIFFKILLYCL